MGRLLTTILWNNLCMDFMLTIIVFLPFVCHSGDISLEDDIFKGVFISLHNPNNGFKMELKYNDTICHLVGKRSQFPYVKVDTHKINSVKISYIKSYIDSLFIKKEANVFIINQVSKDIVKFDVGSWLTVRVSSDGIHFCRTYMVWDINYFYKNNKQIIEYSELMYTDTFRRLVSTLLAIAQEQGLFQDISYKENFWRPWSGD